MVVQLGSRLHIISWGWRKAGQLWPLKLKSDISITEHGQGAQSTSHTTSIGPEPARASALRTRRGWAKQGLDLPRQDLGSTVIGWWAWLRAWKPMGHFLDIEHPKQHI